MSDNAHLSSFFDGCTVTHDQVKSAYFATIIGRPDSGKSFLAGHAPDPFFLATEKGAELVPNVGKVKYIDENGNERVQLPLNYDQFDAIWQQIAKKKGNIQGTQYKTIVVDSAKFTEEHFCNDVVKKNPSREEKGVTKENICVKDILFGGGVALVYSYWEKFFEGVTRLNQAGINVILICHTCPVKAVTPSGEEYKKEGIDLLRYGAVSVPDLVLARSDWCYHIRKEAKVRNIKKDFGGSKTVPMDGTKQDVVVYTRGTSGLDAKCKTADHNNIPDCYVIDINRPETSQVIFDDLLK